MLLLVTPAPLASPRGPLRLRGVLGLGAMLTGMAGILEDEEKEDADGKRSFWERRRMAEDPTPTS